MAFASFAFFTAAHAEEIPNGNAGIKVEVVAKPEAWHSLGYVTRDNDIYVIYGGDLYNPDGTATKFKVKLRFDALGGYLIKKVGDKTFAPPVVTYTEQGNDGEGFEVSADQKVSIGYTVVDGSEQTISGTVYLLPVELERDLDVVDDQWKPIVGDYAKALPGERINLRVKTTALPAGVKVDGFKWTLPDKVFGDYIATYERGEVREVIEIDPEALKKQSVGFHFTTSGEKEILVKFDVDGSPFQAEATINVAKPGSSFSTQKGLVRLGFPPHPIVSHALGFLGETTPLFGVRFASKVSTPEGWPDGKWAYAQLIRFKRTYTIPPTGNTTVLGDGMTWMHDGPYPYGGVAGENIANGNSRADQGDSPFDAAVSSLRTSISINESFQTYLMFLPAGAASRWVPLRKIDWKWGGKATAEDNWAKVTDPIAEVDPEAAETEQHPEWSANSNDAEESPIN